MEDYPIVPGRGLNTRDATEMRHKYLEHIGISVKALAETKLDYELIRNKIESFIGSVEIPVGIVGPLLFRNGDKEELVYTAAAALEGALIASMNRGAKAISLSGGFSAAFIHQKMIRSPLFIFSNLQESIVFKNWVETQFEQIKHKVEHYSNHAKLQSIATFVTGKGVHLKFTYTTGDASGQNMTTTCTWHGLLWISKAFEEATGIAPEHFVIEGNGASDKKVSAFSMMHGRGVHVVAECELDEDVIAKVLRTTSTDFIRNYSQSRVLSQLDGMVGYNINVANAVAAIFAATGQDLACIHESATGILNIEKTERGLYCSLNLPTLVIGTVGGGTHLSKQQEALQIMQCDGAGKLKRFAELLAGFALALELSTFAAIVGGHFAKAHEKLGRNKPVNWLTKSDLTAAFVSKCLNGTLENHELVTVGFPEEKLIENGIIISLTSRINRKITGFVPLELELKNKTGAHEITHKRMLLKSKPLDSEVIKGLHLMAASIDPQLADLLSEYQEVTEYTGCHRKEILLYEQLRKTAPQYLPAFYGTMTDEIREVYLLLIERLDYDNLQLINSENEPEKWTEEHIRNAIRAISEIHAQFTETIPAAFAADVKPFEPWKAKPLYHKFAQIIDKEYEDYEWHALTKRMYTLIEELEQDYAQLRVPKTVVHNDFNPRNVCVRSTGEICIYDWELAVQDVPHRDIVEFLCFALPDDFDKTVCEKHLRYHHSLQQNNIAWNDWKAAYVYALKEFLVTRVSFYLTGRILMDYKFAVRIFRNAFRMMEILE